MTANSYDAPPEGARSDGLRMPLEGAGSDELRMPFEGAGSETPLEGARSDGLRTPPEGACALSPVELLAPAGNTACLHAAVRAGADAVYLGLGEFNARRNADNFTLESFAQACDFAHVRGVRVYVTLNIEILPSEMDRALDLARNAFCAGADAFIVQDFGLASALAEELPEAELHISTQMNIHNAAGIEAAARLGASRVTLARELSFGEIAALAAVAREFGMEVETFAHGALCVCYSGQCLMSSLIGGRSANRGLCAQACRLPYELQSRAHARPLPAEGEHLLSPRDLSTIEVLPEMVATGASSLKIEGRMKSASYVHTVVSVYRNVLDRTLAGEDARPTEQQSSQLAEAFSRGFTTAYLTGGRGNDIMSYRRPNNRGVFAGRVASVGNGFAVIDAACELHAGDVIEFWTNRGHFACTLDASCFTEGGTVRARPDQKVGKGDRVFRVRNVQAEFVDDAFEPRVPVRGVVELLLGRPAHISFEPLFPNGLRGERMAAAFASGGYALGEAWGDPIETARTKPLEIEDVRSHVDRLGQTPFALADCEVRLSAGVGMGFSQLHRLRAEALDNLQKTLLAPYCARSVQQRPVRPAPEGRVRVSRPCRDVLIAAWATNPVCARAAKRAGADAIYVPVLNYRRGQAVLAGVRQDEVDQAGYPKQCIRALPLIDHDPVGGSREEALDFDPWNYVRAEKTVFADSLASCVRAQAEGAGVEIGPHVPLTNIRSLKAAADWGAQRVWLSPELTLGQIADLAEDAPVELGVFLIGAQEVMVCEHCLLMSQGPCDQRCGTCPRRSVEHHLRDRKDFDFPVVTDALGRSHLYNGVMLDLAPNLPGFLDMGVSAFMVDTTLMGKDEAAAAVARAVRARKLALEGAGSVEKRRGVTTGHLFRGVS